jgi:hypothetical protein
MDDVVEEVVADVDIFDLSVPAAPVVSVVLLSLFVDDILVGRFEVTTFHFGGKVKDDKDGGDFVVGSTEDDAAPA